MVSGDCLSVKENNCKIFRESKMNVFIKISEAFEIEICKIFFLFSLLGLMKIVLLLG
jgi:hypothetical protein